ncbi:MAG: HAMP domain-containing histidine kinase [Gemmatimonadota bacterium]|nr:HAMP domain-containing histidine kinase [Gemmatimonadota bacterium]MDE3174411.1 HAMP domain-containing histidine kinase [Gemmatimonadota bacterium]
MKRLGFRNRLFVILLSFALVPSAVLGIGWFATSRYAFSLVGSTTAWDSVAATGARAILAMRSVPLTPAQRRAIDAHERQLHESLVQSKRAGFVFQRAVYVAGAAILLFALGVVGFGALRVAGHLSRQLSRPLLELMGWTERVGRGEPLPEQSATRGAPEFEVLRTGMRAMAGELTVARTRALEAARASALRDAARQAAHELKNPLTPIRFAVARLQRDAPVELAETVEVLASETSRLEALARNFSQFGKLPEGPRSPVDLGELARYTARASIPEEVPMSVDVEAGLPMVWGHHDALQRALQNVVLNAVDACREAGRGAIAVTVRRSANGVRDAVELAVRDTGPGIAADRLALIWQPYVTFKAGGTGLGMAIARQTVLAHDGEATAESAPGEGTTIRFVIPVGTEGPEAPGGAGWAVHEETRKE